jgi:hypothetical protein
VTHPRSMAVIQFGNQIVPELARLVAAQETTFDDMQRRADRIADEKEGRS